MSLRGLIEEHRGIEQHLHRLATLLDNPGEFLMSFTELWPVQQAHYAREEAELFAAIEASFPEFVRKLREQHDEARELGAHLHAGPSADFTHLARRFVAISQHNMVEEERDLFPLLDDDASS